MDQCSVIGAVRPFTNGSFAHSEIQPFTGSGAIGSGGPFNAPCDPLDLCAYWHDVCLNLGARIQNPGKRQCWRRKCDYHLAVCADNIIGDPRSILIVDIFGAPYSPNNNQGQFVQGLGPDPTQ